MATIDSINVKLGANTREFNQKMSRARGTIKSMTGAVIGLAGTVGLGALIKRSLDSADKLQKLRDATGLSTEFLSAFRFVASQTGTDLDTITRSVSKMQRAIEDANDGLSTQVRAFEKLGVPIEAMKALKPEDQFTVILDALSKMTNETTRAAVGQQIFGRGFTALGQLSRIGASGIAKLVKEAGEANQIMGDKQVNAAAAANDAIDKLSKTWAGFTQNLVLRYAPAIRTMVQLFGDTLPRAIANIANGFRAFGQLIGASLAALIQFSTFNFRGGLEISRSAIADFSSNISGRGSSLDAGGPAKDSEAQRRLVQLAEEQADRDREFIALVRGGRMVAGTP